EKYKCQKFELKQSLSIDSEKLIILSACKLIPRKRVIDLLKAYEELPSRVRTLLVIVGDGNQKQDLEEYVKTRGLYGVSFVGFKNQLEIVKYYAIADIFVLPSVGEPWGLVINEAMNFGLPIVATDKVGSAYDLIKEGENGFIYPAKDVNALSLIIEKFINDRQLIQKMGSMSRDIIKKWSYDADIETLISILRSKGEEPYV
ncbi:MAG: glycosyltransferase family 4 protein, partial [Candidatus Omnitrophota bacterium]